MSKQSVIVSGSLAYDRIFNFPGRFSEVILPKKIHILNVSFNVSQVQESFGGTAGNIAYTLRLLGLPVSVISAVGSDGQHYFTHLRQARVDSSAVVVSREKRTASAHIITDRDDNQITAFQIGALAVRAWRNRAVLRRLLWSARYAVLAPGNTADMLALAQACIRHQVDYLFDPGQILPVLSKSNIRFLHSHAAGFISNDYELDLAIHRSGFNRNIFLRRVPFVVTTLGSDGVRCQSGAKTIRVKAARPRSEIDPTGAGDAFRAGFVAGLTKGKTLETALKMGAVASVYTVEKRGTQTHTFTHAAFRNRYRQNYRESLLL